MADQVTERWLVETYPQAKSLHGHYKAGQSRKLAYNGMVSDILSAVRTGKKTVAAFCGHSCQHAVPSRESVRLAREEGLMARELPGISADACLMADLLVYPANYDWQCVEAAEFTVHDVDISCEKPLMSGKTYRQAGHWSIYTQGFSKIF